ncbi:MAG: nucleotidyltransferase family protein, partial [Myxococcota bacterium]
SRPIPPPTPRRVMPMSPLPPPNAPSAAAAQPEAHSTEHAALAAAVALSNPLRCTPPTLQGIDASAIARRSHQLGTTPAVAHHLNALGLGAQLGGWDRQLVHETVARNMLALTLAQEAARLLEEEAGIRSAALKGLAALLDWYGENIGLRKMFDTDLLIDAATFTRAHQVLVEHGWTRVIEGPVTSRVNVEAVFIQRFGRSGSNYEVKLELHRALTFPGRFWIHPGRLWDRAIRLDTTPRWRLDPIDALLYLAVHKVQHGYRNDARDLFDAANLLHHHPQLDWDRLIVRAQRWGATAAAWLFLRRARRAALAPVPDAILTLLRPCHPRATLLDHLMPDATTDLQFRQRRTHQIPLNRRLLGLAAAADRPQTEVAALTAIAVRRWGDAALSSLPMGLGERLAAHTLDLLPLFAQPLR